MGKRKELAENLLKELNSDDSPSNIETVETYFNEVVDRYWLAHYVQQNTCVLCGNSGIIDTTETAITPEGSSVGGKHFCACPNGQRLRSIGFEADKAYKPEK